MTFIFFCSLTTNICLAQQSECTQGDCQNGHGILNGQYSDGSSYSYSGEFRYSLPNGDGALTTDTYTETGVFLDGTMIEGVYSSELLHQTGTFNKRKLHGVECFEVNKTGEGASREREGRFINGALFTGIEKNITSSGFIEECSYIEGEVVGCKRNDKNHYEAADVTGPPETIVDITYVNNQAFLPVEIGDVFLDIKWDTGAFGLVFSKTDFGKLINSGVEILDLDLSISTVGVLGIPSETSVFIIKEVSIGDMTIKNVVVNYNPLFENSLLGLDFFNKFL